MSEVLRDSFLQETHEKRLAQIALQNSFTDSGVRKELLDTIYRHYETIDDILDDMANTETLKEIRALPGDYPMTASKRENRL